MSYIGRGIDQIDNISTLDNLSFNGSDTTFNLTQNSVAFVPVSADALQIQIDGVIQSGNYTVSGSTVTFDFTPSGSSVCNGIKHFGVGLLTTVSDGAVTEAKIGSGAVTQAKVGDQAINEAKMQISNAPVNGYMLTAQSGNTGGLTWAEAPSGDIVKISSASDYSTGVAKLNIDQFSTTYKFYKFYATLRHESGGSDLRFRWRTGGAEQSGSYYIYTGTRGQINSGGTTTNAISHSGFYTNYALMTGNSTASNNHDILLDLTFFDPMTVNTAKPYVMGNIQWYRDDDVFIHRTFSAKYNTASLDYNGFALWAGTGNIEDYQWTLYGVKS